MAWYEISALFFCIGSFASVLGVFCASEYRKNKAYIEMLRKQMAFYEIAGEWFAKDLEVK